MDSQNFANWTEKFVQSIASKTQHGRKVLLLYDGCRSHLVIWAMKNLRDGGVIAYCLPAHTSGKNHPLDVGLYNALKYYVSDQVRQSTSVVEDSHFDQFDILKFITAAYKRSFTTDNIMRAFAKAGVWPLNGVLLLGVCRPVSADRANIMMDPAALKSMLEQKRRAADVGHNIQPVVAQRGYLDTQNGLVVTSDEAMEPLTELHRLQHQKRSAAEAKEASK